MSRLPMNMTICGYGNDKYWENNKCHNNNLLIALVDAFVQTIAKMVCFSLFPSCKTKSFVISRHILTELYKVEALMQSPFWNVCIRLMTCTPQTHLIKKNIRKAKQLINWMYNYNSYKQYSCELYIHTNLLSWVGIEGAQSLENWKAFFPIS